MGTPIEKKNQKFFQRKRTNARTMECHCRILSQKTYYLLYLLHHPVSVCRRICNENRSSLPESSTFRRRTWIDRTTNRTVLWNIWCCSFRYRFDTGRILYFSFRTTQNIILILLYLQSSICRICISGPLST